MSLFPYRFAAAQESARTGMPMMRALVLSHQHDDGARKVVDEYEFGPDFLVAPMLTLGTQRPVYIPEGEWLDLWTGKPVASKQTSVVDVPMDSIAAFVRAGSIVPKIPEDVMTLVPSSESGNRDVHTLDDRRVYEVYPGPSRSITDFEGRSLETARAEGGDKLELRGKAAHVTLRFPFASVSKASVNGKAVDVLHKDGVVTVTFAHQGTSTVTWTR